MKRLATIVLTICFASVSLLFSSGGPLFAQEEKGESGVEALREEKEALSKQIESLRRQLDEIGKKRREGQPAAVEAPREVELLVQPGKGRERTLRSPSAVKLPAGKSREAVGAGRSVEPAVVPRPGDIPLAEATPLQVVLETRPPEEGRAGDRQIVVEKGETIWGIARKYRVSPEEIIEINKLEGADSIFPGQVLAIPPAGTSPWATTRVLAQGGRTGIQFYPGMPGMPGVPGKRGIELRKQELEKVMRSLGDKGLVTLLRFEKAKVCRKAGMYDDAVQELHKIIEKNLADETTKAARWTLVEILQEQKKNEEAIAELEKIFISASDTQDRTDAIYGIINLSGEGPKARIQAIDRLIQALLRDQANWDGCTRNLKQLYAAERKYAEDHGGFLSHKLSDLYPDYMDNFEVFTCPASGDQKITKKEDIDSLTSYLLVAKGEPAESPVGEAMNIFPAGRRSEHKVWIREKEQNHGRRWLTVSSNGAVGWFAR